MSIRLHILTISYEIIPSHIPVNCIPGVKLYACSKGRPTKSLAEQRLECPEQIEEELAGLGKDFLLNDNCKVLVLVSMATDEMIQLVSMYSEVWFMDATAGESIYFIV